MGVREKEGESMARTGPFPEGGLSSSVGRRRFPRTWGSGREPARMNEAGWRPGGSSQGRGDQARVAVTG